ncbi:hypothetical protein [Hydrogenoanaerobacterium sp.]|uniref:hypothetical protein n=1 Tax=Hydrogenoanaerobacterium sp. TaxID=2953763 RepID=UPI00289718F2|nr:hypothetical protein [Hydrogenoanaerobacterium sp.]
MRNKFDLAMNVRKCANCVEYNPYFKIFRDLQLNDAKDIADKTELRYDAGVKYDKGAKYDMGSEYDASAKYDMDSEYDTDASTEKAAKSNIFEPSILDIMSLFGEKGMLPNQGLSTLVNFFDTIEKIMKTDDTVAEENIDLADILNEMYHKEAPQTTTTPEDQKLLDGKQVPVARAYPRAGEIIINGGMEQFYGNVPIGWTTTTPLAVEKKTSQGRVHSGNSSVNLGNGAHLVQTFEDVAGGNFYELSFYAHGEGEQAGLKAFVIYETDVGDVLGGCLTVRKQDMISGSRNFGYYRVLTSATPNNIKRLKLQFVVSSNEDHSVDLDDVSFKML